MRVIIFLLSLSFTFNVYAAELKTLDDARVLAKNAMAKIATGDIQSGLQIIKPYLIIPESEFTVVAEKLKMQEPIISQRFGNALGTEFVKEEEIGKSLFLIIYIQKFEKHIMRWRFYFYKPKDTWILNTFFTDDKIQSMFND